MQFKGVFYQLGPCIWSRNPYGKIKVKDMEEEEEEEEEEDKKREREHFCRRDFLTQYKAPVAKKHPKIVFLGAHFAGRAI